MRYFIIEIIKAFWIQIIFLAITISLLLRLTNIEDQQIFQIVLGVMLGVILGFVADLSKRSFDDLNAKLKLRKVSLKLLSEDAKSIYRTVWLWEGLQKSNQVPLDVKGHIPPELDLKYWYKLKENNEFLLLAAEAPFDEIFNKMFNFEKINEQIKLAKTGDRNAIQFSHAFYKITADEQFHKTLLLHFMSEKDIQEMDKKYSEAIQNK